MDIPAGMMGVLISMQRCLCIHIGFRMSMTLAGSHCTVMARGVLGLSRERPDCRRQDIMTFIPLVCWAKTGRLLTRPDE